MQRKHFDIFLSIKSYIAHLFKIVFEKEFLYYRHLYDNIAKVCH